MGKLKSTSDVNWGHTREQLEAELRQIRKDAIKQAKSWRAFDQAARSEHDEFVHASVYRTLMWRIRKLMSGKAPGP